MTTEQPRPRITAAADYTGRLTADGLRRESSVIPIRVPSYARGVTDSVLLAPRFPRSANSPRLEVGKDFMPSQGEPGWAEAEAHRLSTQVRHVRRAGRNPWPALLATGFGFGLGVLIAWLTGAI